MNLPSVQKLRAFAAGIAHESNSFSPIPTTQRSFETGLLYRPGDVRALEQAYEFPAYGDLLEAAAARGIDAMPGTFAWAQPSGPVSLALYEHLRDEIVRELRAAGPLDMVLLTLHGAMVAEGYDDCEGDLIACVRDVVGPDTPIGALLDLHGNLSARMIASGAILIACKEYPHSDYRDRAEELLTILVETHAGRIRPASLMRRVPMLGLFGTTDEPMKSFVERLKQSEGGNILSVSAMHGFPWSDTDITGASILVVFDAGDVDAHARAERLARTLASAFFDLRGVATGAKLPIDEAIDKALSLVGETGPVVLADGADNPGGGAASDSTFIVQRLLERGIRDVAVGMIWDPVTVAQATQAGVGATLALTIGGKVGAFSGTPVRGQCEVLCAKSDACQRGLDGQVLDALGDAVAVRLNGIDIVVNSIRQQTFSPDCFTAMGIDMNEKKMIVVKSTQHFRLGFDPIAGATVYCDAPGSLNLDLSKLPYTRIVRPLWPMDPAEAILAEQAT
jgi:microcystin degradation protein MlrC